MAVAWGIRGQFGHERGAMIGGVLGALAIVLISPDDAKRNRAAALGVAGGLGLAIGGSMSYGDIAGWLGRPSFHLLCSVLLAFKGAIWGGLGGCALGMALSDVRYTARDLVWLPTAIAACVLGGWFHPEGEISRGDMAWGLLTALLLLLLWLRFVKHDRAAILVALCSAAGFGVGFPLGSWICVWGERTGIPVDWWKVAEMTWGCCGGLSWGLAAFMLDEEGVGPREIRWGTPTWIGFIYVAWLVPCWNGFNTMTYWSVENAFLPRGSLIVYVAACLLALAAFAFMIARFRPALTAMRIAGYAFLWVLWSTFALQFLKVGFPNGVTSGEGFWWTQAAFVVCAAALTLFAWRRMATH